MVKSPKFKGLGCEFRCDMQNGHTNCARKLLILLVPSTRFELVTYRV